MRKRLWAIALASFAFAFVNATYAQQAVLQRGYDPGLSGANLTETTLTPSNVTPTTFGLRFTLPVDDKIYAQPLYVPQVAIAGQGTHNVVYVATMSDTLYAFDADVGGTPLWSLNFASSVGAVPVPFANFTFGGNTNIAGNLGILSTPVIDSATNIMYLVACTLEGGTMVYRLHAVNIASGTEPLTNVVISASYSGVNFVAAHQNQRASLTLSGNEVVFGFAAVEAETDDEGGYTGWVMAYDKRTLVQSGVFATVTTGATHGGGVWQSGRPPVVDSGGFVYVFTGNGYQSGYNGETNFSESAVRLDPTDGLALVDWFTPSNWSTMDAQDLDMASSGPLLIPGTTPPLIAGGGKTGVLYVLNTTDLGQYTATDSGVVQKETISASSFRGGPVYWQRSTANGGPLLFDWGTSDWVKSYAFNGTKFGSTPSTQGSGAQIYPGGILTLSANGQTQGTGVVWATVAASGNVYNDATDPGVMYAFNADNLATTLWTSTTNSARDNFGTFAKFVPPLVANGKVYVATFSDLVAVYGLLGPTSVGLSGAYNIVGIGNAGTTVSSSGGMDGFGFTYAESLLGTSFTWSGSTFVLGGADVADAVSSATIALPAGSYSTVQMLATGVDGDQLNQTFVVKYTDGTTTTIVQSLSDWYTPQNYSGESIASTMAYRIGPTGAVDNRTFYLYGYSFAINGAKTVQSITLPNNRDVVVLGIDLVAASGSPPPPPQTTATPTFSPPAGTYTATQQVTLSDTTTGAVIYYTTNGTTPGTSSTQYVSGTPISVGATETIEAMAVASGYTNSAVATGTYTISASGIAPVSLSTVDDVIGIGNAGTTVSSSGGMDGYGFTYAESLLGTSFTWSGSTFVLGGADVADAVSGATIALPAGSYSTVQMLATGVDGAQTNQTFVVKYTDGTTTSIVQSLSDWYTPQHYTGESIASTMAYRIGPTGAVDNRTFYLYGYSFAINGAKTVQSITLPNNRDVVVLGIDLVAASGSPPPPPQTTATPTFSPPAGTYTATQQVTLSDTTTGAVIYYTTNGTTPGTSSTQYVSGTPISVGATETIEAMAVASGYTNSAVATGTYTISASGIAPVSLSTVDDVIGIGNAGTTVSSSGGMDGYGFTYAESLLGASFTWSGSTFVLGGADVADAVSRGTVVLPAGSYSSVQMLATGVDGAQTNQTFVVKYTDGTTTSIVQSLSDWYTPQSYAGESIASTMAYRIAPSGAVDNRTFYLYGYSFAINGAKTVQSITLPNNRDVVVLAIDLVP